MGADSVGVRRGRSGLGSHDPKCLSMTAIISSGLKSPERHIAMLFGT